VVAPDGRELERFPAGSDGQNGSGVPFDSPSSAKFLGTRLMVPNQSFLTGDPNTQTLLDVETGEPGHPELIPPGAGGVDSTVPALAGLRLSPSRVRSGRNFVVRLRLSEAAKLTVRVDRRVGSRWRRVITYFRPGTAGTTAFRLGARVRRSGRKRPFAPGRYRVVIRGVDTSGNASPEVVRGLRVVR
jgi:hypothetical protein